MRFRDVITILGKLYVVIGLLMIVPLSLSLLQQDSAGWAFVITSCVSVVFGLLLHIRQPSHIVIERRESVLIIVFGWVTVSIIGALPFFLSGCIPHFADAFFESISGFTTTGASILDDIEALPQSLLLWRSLTHWIGGMGIVILALVVLPAINTGSRNLYNFESSSIAQERITPKIKDTARLLWSVYLLLTIIQTLLLVLGGLSLFDAALTAMATIPTGGFSPRNASIAAYSSLYTEIIVMLFMVLAGINFSLYIQLFRAPHRERKFGEIIRFYLAVLIIASLIVVVDLRLFTYASWGEALRYGVFQVISINTTSGFVTADYQLWRPTTHVVLLILMLIGACPGSTTGAIKNARIILLLKSIYRELIYRLHPRAVHKIQIDQRVIDDDTVRSALVYVGMYIAFFFLATLAMALSGIDTNSSIFSVATTLGGVGPGLGLTGPIHSYAALPLFNKGILMACMLFGRLEFYAIFLLFIPRFWRKT